MAQTNGKAERFIWTALHEWGYATAYPSCDHCVTELSVWIHRYNRHRTHGGIKCQTPVSRLGLTGRFDVAVMASVLLHTQSLLQIMARCARFASTLIATDRHYEELEGSTVCRLQPNAKNKTWDSWWRLSSDIVRQFADVLGFTKISTSKHVRVRPRGDVPVPFFTVIASNE